MHLVPIGALAALHAAAALLELEVDLGVDWLAGGVNVRESRG
jgi:hypothetical protein